MATVRIKTQGTSLNGLEMENFATEETLTEILAELKSSGGVHSKENKSPQGKGRRAGDNASQRFNEGLSKVTNDLIGKKFPLLANAASSMLKLSSTYFGTTVAVDLLGRGLHAAGRSIASMAHVAGGFIATMTAGGSHLSDYTDALAKGTQSLPVIGTIIGAIAGFINHLDKWNALLIDLTSEGANFSGSIIDMMANARYAGLALDVYAKIVQENTELFASFGGVMKGTLLYTNIAKIAMRDYSDTLGDMGITVEQFSSELPGLMKVMGPSMMMAGASNRDLAISAISLTKEFDLMAQMTGKSRREQAEQLAALQLDAAWKEKLSSLNKDQQAQLQLGLVAASTINKSTAEAFKLQVLGMPPMTDAMKKMYAVMPDVISAQKQVANSALNGSLTQDTLNNAMADSIQAHLAAGESLKNIMAAASAGKDIGFGQMAEDMANMHLQNDGFIKNNVLQRQTYLETLQKNAQNTKTEDTIAKQLNDIHANLRKFASSFFDTIIRPMYMLIGPMLGVLANTLDVMSHHIWLALASIAAGIAGVGLIIKMAFKAALSHLISGLELLATRVYATASGMGGLGGAGTKLAEGAMVAEGAETAAATGGIMEALGLGGAATGAVGGVAAGTEVGVVGGPIGMIVGAIAGAAIVGIGAMIASNFDKANDEGISKSTPNQQMSTSDQQLLDKVHQLLEEQKKTNRYLNENNDLQHTGNRLVKKSAQQ